MARLDRGRGPDKKEIIRARFEISGVIQGVGFRPFVYRLAKTRGLTGHVANTAAGVIINIEGGPREIDDFAGALANEKPPLAEIQDIQITRDPIAPDDRCGDFQIIESIAAGSRIGPITPDSDVCGNCLAELFNAADRRYLYPFINCTDCGPRYTLIEETPYDRPLTTMKQFPMCESCRVEYNDPLDRRFHAQATCCPDCGPAVFLATADGRIMPDSDPIRRAAELLLAGKIIAVKGIGGFHLAVNAADFEAIARLRERKGRPDKPLAVMAATLDRIKAFALFSRDELKVLRSGAKPIVLLRKSIPFRLAENVAPDNCFVGVMLPYTPIHHLLFYYQDFEALVMTSGNLSGSPVVKDNDEAFAKLAKIADYFLLHNRAIVTQADDSVVRMSGEDMALYRRARSFVPTVVNLKQNCGRTLALGAIIKNTICLTKESEAFVSQHIGDLDNFDTQLHQKNISRHFQALLRVEPDLLVYDLHPDYPGSRYARSQKQIPAVAVQHHHAHAVSCMAEHGLDRPVIAVTLDGNGYGPDQTVWGGEVLLATCHDFERLAHLASVEMPGGDAATLEPWRMAVSHLYRAFGPDYKGLDLQLLRDQRDKLNIIEQMMEKSVNAPLTSSCGRLFDSVAALLGVRYSVSFEGQAAAALEMLLDPRDADRSAYSLEIMKPEGKPWVLPVKPIIRGVVHDILAGLEPPQISRRFHNTLAAIFTELCLEIRDEKQISNVVLSGGVFQNLNLLQQLKTGLEDQAFTVYCHEQVPANDGGISLGQAVAGRTMWEREKESRGPGS